MMDLRDDGGFGVESGRREFGPHFIFNLFYIVDCVVLRYVKSRRARILVRTERTRSIGGTRTDRKL